MPRPGDVILAYMLTPQMVGSYFDRRRWPLHITLLPWFSAPPARRTELESALQLMAQTQPPVRVTAGDTAQFGPNGDVPVRLITEAALLRPLHEALLSITRLLQLPLTVSAAHTGSGYTPHVSQYEDRRVELGQQMMVSSVYLIELQRNNICQIIAEYPLKGRIDAETTA